MNSSIRIVTVSGDKLINYSRELQKLESLVEYPYGNDTFRISHGLDYFAFFQRLGEVRFHFAIDRGRVVACAAGVLRTVTLNDTKTLRTWYLCDLKVHPEFQKQRIPARLFAKDLWLNYLKCSRAYAVSMNPSGSRNRVISLINNFNYIGFRALTQLNFYTLSAQDINNHSAELREQLGPFSFLSLRNKKDLIVSSTNSPMNILHFQYGPFANFYDSEPPNEKSLHMICAPAQTQRDQFLQTLCRAQVQATAVVLTHQLPEAFCKHLLTSDI